MAVGVHTGSRNHRGHHAYRPASGTASSRSSSPPSPGGTMRQREQPTPRGLFGASGAHPSSRTSRRRNSSCLRRPAPTVRLRAGMTREIRWPANRLYASATPDESADLILLIGTEPQLRWQTFCNGIIDLAQGLGVDKVITLGALLEATPHTPPHAGEWQLTRSRAGRSGSPRGAWAAHVTKVRPA